MMRIAFCLILAMGCGCAARVDPPPSPAEERMIEHLTADRYMGIRGMHRNEQGNLVIWTQQGEESVEYELTPDAGGRLRFHRLPSHDSAD